MVLVQPAQKAELLLPADRVGRLLELRHGAFHEVEHGGEVGHRGARILQRLAHAGEKLAFAILAHAVEDHLDHRLRDGRAGLRPHALGVAADLHHRVEHGPDGEAEIGDLAHDGVHQEGGVRLDDLQPVVIGVAAAGGDRPHDANGGRQAAALLGEAPEVGEVRRQVGGREVGQLVGGDVLAHLGGEVGEGGTRRVGAQRAQQFGLELALQAGVVGIVHAKAP